MPRTLCGVSFRIDRRVGAEPHDQAVPFPHQFLRHARRRSEHQPTKTRMLAGAQRHRRIDGHGGAGGECEQDGETGAAAQSKLGSSLSMSVWSMARAGSCGPFSSISGGGGGGIVSRRPPKAATRLATFASIVFSVDTTLVMRCPVMSWKLQAS